MISPPARNRCWRPPLPRQVKRSGLRRIVSQTSSHTALQTPQDSPFESNDTFRRVTSTASALALSSHTLSRPSSRSCSTFSRCTTTPVPRWRGSAVQPDFRIGEPEKVGERVLPNTRGSASRVSHPASAARIPTSGASGDGCWAHAWEAHVRERFRARQPSSPRPIRLGVSRRHLGDGRD